MDILFFRAYNSIVKVRKGQKELNRMSSLASQIERYLKKLLANSQSGYIDVRRNDLAKMCIRDRDCSNTIGRGALCTGRSSTVRSCGLYRSENAGMSKR